MLKELGYKVKDSIVDRALVELQRDDFRTTINQPTSSFFYDPWLIKDEYKGTIWEQLLSSLPFDIGEARIIVLKPGTCYHSHADIDDRYHLNLSGQYSYLIDLESNVMHPTVCDKLWYEMDAGLRHVAANFGSTDRIQIVVRKLLKRNQLLDFCKVKITPVNNFEKARFIFDDHISPWLNRAVKNGIINNFNTDLKCAEFDIEKKYIEELKKILTDSFNITQY